jgi:hypothetical protein
LLACADTNLAVSLTPTDLESQLYRQLRAQGTIVRCFRSRDVQMLKLGQTSWLLAEEYYAGVTALVPDSKGSRGYGECRD